MHATNLVRLIVLGSGNVLVGVDITRQTFENSIPFVRLVDFCSGFNLVGLKGMQHELNRRT